MDAGNARGVTHRGAMVQLFETNAILDENYVDLETLKHEIPQDG